MALSTARRLPLLARSLHTTTSISAAAATAARTTYVRRTAVPSSSPSSRLATTKPVAVAPPPSVEAEYEDTYPEIDDDIISSMAGSPSTRPSPSTRSAPTSNSNESINVQPSPPLKSFPNDQYKSLPSAEGIPGESVGPDWTTSFSGLSAEAFSKDAAEELMAPLQPNDIEIKPDGLLYLPGIKYRRTLNKAFGPGAWGLAPRGETNIGDNIVSREWGLVVLGRLVSIARGEQEYFGPQGITTATEAVKSNALMRCCKDLGIASELWDPAFIRDFKDKHCAEVFVEHAKTKAKKKMWRKKTGAKFAYPYTESR